jgi:ribonuclease-3
MRSPSSDSPRPRAGSGPGLPRLEERLGHAFANRDLLTRALTHSSFAHEGGSGPDNEALEFLGDAALGFLVAQAVMKRFPEMDEGGLSKLKGFLVSRPNLAQVARRLGLGVHLRLGKTAEQGLARTKESLLADTLEAVIAAVFLDGGDQPARAVVNRLFGGQIQRLSREEIEEKDYKTAFQELMQAGGRPAPRYKVVRTEGPAHSPTFHVGLVVDGKEVAVGKGLTKKEAEQRAARAALRFLRRSTS